MDEFQRMQLILQLKSLKLQFYRTFPQLTGKEVQIAMKEDEQIKEIMERVGLNHV